MSELEATGLNSDSSSEALLNGLKVREELTDIPNKLQDDSSSTSDLVCTETSTEPNKIVKVDDEPVTSENETEKPNKPEWDDVLGSGSLKKKILKDGTPDTRPERLDNCMISYKCMLEDGTAVEEHDVLELQLGDAEVVQGLDLALGLMNVGEKCLLKIESRLAYGSKGLEPFIFPDTTVVFEVELLSVEADDNLETFTVSQRRIKGNKKRERGNWWYSRGENQLAIQCYRRALDFLDEAEGGIKEPLPDGFTPVTDSALQELLEDRISVCNNMAAAQLKLELFDAALQSLQTVLRCQPDNVKALFRKAKVYRAKNDVTAALKCLLKANIASPNNTDIQKEISALQVLIKKQKNTEKELARRMFNGPRSGQQNKRNTDLTSTKLLVWATLGASLAVGLAGFVAYRFKFT